ncbi:hypothetical protein KIN20_010652 [Parelaphostrongylus tenuis]|uniref:Muscle M-line assembly protein unc-89 n=1 Tax=Parelaphostrongylus tenuis TaxID=148309 RepID=A0AAD5M865_PARTN|nr:hypothetical protein KIN20_010652 [Parelaphostrongylus tenuis]
MGEVSTEGPLEVIAPIPVEFETTLCDATCREGDTLKLKAVLLGEPTPVVTWYVNGKKLEESQNIKIHSEKGTYTVTIKDITCDYSGKVVCEAVNEYGRASSEAMLLVLPRGEPPDFLEWLSNVRARQGSKVVHKVVFTGDPKPTLTWYINNKEVQNSSEISIVTDDKTSILTIHNFNPEKHVGEIICKAENDAGEVSCTANMVTYTSDMFSESESEAQAEEVIADDMTLTDDESMREEIQRTPTPVMAPKFITKIKDSRAKRGHEAIFECVVPDTKGVCCKWLKDGKEIELIARIRVQSRTVEGYTTQELIIDDVRPEDAGKYTVIVENKAGKVQCEATLTVVEEIEKPLERAPEFIIKLQDKTTKIHHKVNFECKVVGQPQPKVLWYHENKVLEEHAKEVYIESEDGIQRLVISSAETAHQGKYSCVAENSAGSSRTEATLNVEAAVESKVAGGPAEFVELLCSCTVNEGQQAVLKCKVKGEPRPKIKWTKNGKEVEMTARIKSDYKDDGSLTLTIDSVTQQDAGEYRCHAENEHGSAWTEGPIVVVAFGALPQEGEAPDFIQPVRPVLVAEGETAVLEGKVSGKPKPSIKWYKNGEDVKPSDHFVVESLDDGTQRLTVKNVTMDDMDEYRCSASNEYGDVWSDVTLSVKKKTEEAPSFTKTLVEVSVVEGETATYECKVTGEPQPEIKWFKGNEQISTVDEHFVQTKEADGTARLVIKSAKVKDSGEIRCEASNTAGTARTAAPLSVTLPEEEVAPEFTRDLTACQIMEGEVAHFECKVKGTPLPLVRWFKDGEEVKPKDGVTVEALPDGTNKLTINDAKLTDQGNYRVEATNAAGSTSSKAPLSVQAPETLKLKRPLHDITVERGTKIQLTVEVEGKPKTVKWYKGSTQITATNTTKIERVSDAEYKLEVENCETSDSGAYLVVLSTESESIESRCVVTVKEKEIKMQLPSFKSGLRDQAVPKGQPLLLEVEIEGKPKDVKWYKNGDILKDAKLEDLGDGKYRLTIPDFKETDVGEYSVAAENESGVVESKAKITMKEVPDDGRDKAKPEIVSGLVPTSVKQGETATFSVKVKGPVKAVKWYKNGKEIPDANTKDSGDGVFQLIIPNTNKNDMADYKVVLSNDAGDAESAAALTVKLPQIEVVKGLEDITVDRKQTGVLAVETNRPPQQVKWYKNGKEITPSDKAVPKKIDENKYQLSIPDADKDDTANYKVVLTDDDGNTAESSCALTVKLPAAIELVKALEDTVVPRKQTGVLEISTNKPARTVKWYKNGKEITPSDKVVPKSVADNKYQLTISDADKDDTADYKVVLTDDDGNTVESSCALTVKLPAAIEFIKALQDTIVPKKQTGVLEVETNKPAKAVKWYKNGKEITPSDKAVAKTIADNKYELSIPDADKDDTADYKVVLTDEDGNNAESSCALTVKLPAAIEIVKALEDIVVPKKQTGLLEIRTNKPAKVVKWYKNGKEITPSDKAIPKTVDDNKYQLSIPDVSKEDTANYKVVLTDDDGNAAESSCALTVKLPAGIEIVKGLEDTIVPKGKEAVLEVQTNRTPKQIKWYKNGKELTPSDKPQQKKVDDNKYQLVVPSADDVDAADYKVVLIDDDDNSADSSCALTVRLPDKEPKIIKGLDDRIVAAGMPTIWEIETEGSPRTVKWYKNGREISGAAAAQVKITKVDDNHYVLEIPKCALDDAGSYKVEVENDAGKASSTGKVIIFLESEPQLYQTITEGENVEFRVETNAKPSAVKWYKNGQMIAPDARFVVTDEETKYRLLIKNATRSDATEYKVLLSNSAGDADSSAKLTVLKAKPGLPKIVKELEDQVAAKGASMVFEVKVEGEVDEVRWFKDTIPITAGTNAIIEKVDDSTYRLTIPKADIDDVGQYSVDAVNESGKASSSAKGEVDEKPEIVKGLVNMEVCEGDDSVFKVEVSTPVRTVKWYKNGQELKPSKHFEPKKIGPKKYELAINRTELDDCANFKVVLANAAGECDSSAELTVIKPNILKLLEGLKDIDVNEGEPINLKVRVEGIPKTVKWYKNGAELSPNDVQMNENPETGEYSMMILQSKKSDGAAYRVSLVNEKGEIYSGAVAHVKTVKMKDATSPVNFLSPLEDTEVAEGDMLTLKCVVAGVPFPELTWTKDGVELEKDDRIAIRTALDGTATLRIRDARKSDFGQYRITAKNECSTETSACQVTVKEKGEEPSKPSESQGFPKPTLEWLLNNSPIDLGDRCQVTDLRDGVYCLTVKDIKDSDFGTLRCIATNELGKDECQAQFSKSSFRSREKDDDRYPPRFNVPLWDRRIPVNDPLAIECHVDAKPVAQIEWFKDGKKLEISEGVEIRNTSDGACRVRIARFGKEDVGVYMCVATNPLGVADTRSTYSVEVTEKEEVIEKKEYAPRFNPGLEDMNINAGQSIRLSCTVDAIPKAGIVWYKDGLPLRSGGRFTITTQDDGQCILEVSNTVAGDEGAYRCVASNEHGTTNTSCLVTIKVPKTEIKKEGEEPFFTKGLVDVWTDRGETFTLKCAVTGDPFPEIKWFRNGTLVRDSSRTRIETATDGSCALTVKECTMSDEGVYRCEAENKHGKAKTQATAHVQISIAKSEAPKLEMGSPPRFIIPLVDQTVMIGGAIDLECKVTGEPMPQVKWSKDGGPILEDSRYVWEVDEAKGTYQLRITSVTLNDEGTYRCVATNESGSATTKSFVRIDDGLLAQAPTKNVPPRFTIHLGDARAVEGQPLRLECKVEGSPLPELTWHKDGAQIQPSDRVQMSMGPDGVATLIIPQCCMDDEGIYRVIATNPSGSAHDKGSATVKKAPRDAERRSADKDLFDANKVPKLVEPLENVKVPEKEGFKLRCKFSGEPKLAIKWFKDGERVFPYGRLKLVETDDGVCELLVDSSTRQDAGGYRCVAENQYGSVRTTCEVTVIQKERKPVTDFDATLKEGKAPGFTVPLTVRRAKPGEDVTFECVPYGNPFPQIKWLKDGIELSPSANVSFESLPDGTQRLHLSDVNFFSEGFFRCVATNEHGTASTKAELCIDGDRKAIGAIAPGEPREPEECKPRIRRGLYNINTHKGNVVEMIVCATGWPTPTVKWFKDGKEIVSDGPTGHRVIFTDERGIHHLVILNVGPEDEGDYSLEATNRLGMARTEGALSIIRVREMDGYGPDDRGGMPFPPGFVRQLKNKHVFNRMPTIFDCLVVGSPPPEVDWFHNGIKITPGGRIKIQSCRGGSHALIILDTTLDDIGEYMAVARNSHGTATSSAILDVTVPYLDNIKFNGEMDVTSYLTEEYGFKRPISNLPTPPDRGPFIKEVTGHYLTLSWIPTKRAPPRYPQVSYVVEIRELPEKEWTVLDYNIPEPVCKVRNLEIGKSYQFRVRAENIYGISDPSPASPPSRLMAPPQPVLDKKTKKVIPLLDPYAEKALNQAYAEQYACAPWFVPGVLEKRYCAENDTLTITLNVAGYPDPEIKWKFRGWDIDTSSPTSRCKVYTIGGTETTLLINSFTKDNVGQYQCFATNPYGEAQQNIMVDLATRPSFIQPLNNRTFSDSQPMRLDVRIEGEPFPDLKWLKEWRPIVESSRVKFVQDGPYLCSLIISEPMWRDSGVYTCIAANAAGQATTSCSITVEADGDYNDVEIPKKRAMVEARKIHEIYEIAEDDETRAASGAPIRVKERRTGKEFLAQLKPIDDALQRNVDMYNSLDHPNIVQFHEVIKDGNHALVVYENATGALLDSLAHPGVAIGEPEGDDRERLVRVFTRQLLLALKHMHDMRIAHLDLRPETIMLQDDKLKLVDFGQSRRLLRGLITGTIQGTPEFVSPEIVRGYPLTLATDMWSVGTLTYVLLTGISPFHGDDDNETLANVSNCAYSLKGDEWKPFTDEAADFVKNLLKEIPAERMTVDEALRHPWIADANLKTTPLTADTLREFKYRHKWLERRVFVQQTPSEQLLEAILTPSVTTVAPEKRPEAESAQAVELYDYLRIKERPPPPVEEIPGRRKELTEQNLLYPSAYQHFDSRDPRNQQMFDQYAPRSQQFIPPDSLSHSNFDPRDRRPTDPRRQGGHPTPVDQRVRPVPVKIPLDQFGRLFRPEDLARIPHDSFGRPLDLDQRLPPDQLGRMAQLPPEELKKLKKLGPVPMDQYGQPIQRPQKPQDQKQSFPDHNIQEKKKLVPQSKGENPSKKGVKTTRADELDDPELVHIPLRMIRGERRQIEEEIANRILSDISEEGSITGSLGSAEDLEAMFNNRKQAAREMPPRRSRSRSTTPRAESDASTPTVSPVSTVKEGDFFNDLASLPEKDIKVLERVENDPSIPVGAPLFLEDLHENLVIIDSKSRTPSPAGLSPRRTLPGTKSPVLLSPGREHSMEVVIATKHGKPGFLPPEEFPPEIDDDDAKMDDRKQKVKPLTHKDEFQDLREKLDRENERRKADREELERYRPKNIYKDDLEFDRPVYDVDDSPWDSHYQIGPDTYLMATQGPAFNARVRDYRRNLWGDGAPLVREGILGYRNQDITVRERRRYTDILRELQTGVQPKSNENATALRKAPSLSAIERIKADIEKVSPSATRRNADGTYAPIFVSRLRDVYLQKSSFVVFECVVSGSPSPHIEWQFQGSTLENGGKYMIEQGHSVCRLTISQPAVFDIGEYTCTASNEYGSDKTSSLLITGEAPARPGRPECEIISDTEAFVTWEAPEGPTYLEGIVYRFEYREAGPDDYNAAWVAISESVDDEAAVVKHLEPLTFYQFRVTAKNGFGYGVPSLTSRIVQTEARGAPKLPLDGMRDEFSFNVLTAPQKTSARQLEGISEESESDDMSQTGPCRSLKLLAEDPTKRFQIESLLFKGRFSVIRHSVDSEKESGAHCVAKIRSLQDDKRVISEYETLKEAQHDNVQHLISAYQNNGFLYLFCERLYDDVFSRFTRCDYYTEEQIRLTIGQLASALHWLHFRGIVHLDVNPHNVMFQSKRNWIVKLVDFGSAQFIKESAKPSELDVNWAAPELHIKETPVTVQSDVWGMGVITFCLLSGFHPFTSEYDRPEELKENVINVKCDLNLIPVNASQEALSFVTWALKKNPLRRMRTDEALSHRFLSSNQQMVRRRETIKYASSRLFKTALLTKQHQTQPGSTELERKYGGKTVQ